MDDTDLLALSIGGLVLLAIICLIVGKDGEILTLIVGALVGFLGGHRLGRRSREKTPPPTTSK